jgi:tRNA(fMet)-specific endonuclease VapC
VKYLIDSDWIIDALAGVPAALGTLEQLSADGLAVSIVAFGEIIEGAYLFPDPETYLALFRQFLSGFMILPLTEPIMEVFASNRARLRRQGMLIPDLDLLIAASALSFDLTLLTRNVRHFARLPDLRIYRPV